MIKLLHGPLVSYCVFLVSVVFFATAAIQVASKFGRVVSVAAESLDVGSIGPKTVRELRLSFVNRGFLKSRIVGSKGMSCGPTGCIDEISPSEFTLAFGETREIVVRFQSPAKPGPFEKDFVIYIATNQLDSHEFKIVGVVEDLRASVQ